MRESPSERFSRQELFAPIGPEGQRRIAAARVVLIGCGALGSTLANALVRAGVGELEIVDDDRLEWSNLQRQTLFEEEHVRQGRFKAEAALDVLGRINPTVRLAARLERLNAGNVENLIGKPQVVLDATDNFRTRYLINDYCVREGLPWIYGGCAAAYGTSLSVIPERTPCLRCLFPEPPAGDTELTCHQVGIIGPIAHLVASIQGAEALKILSGHPEAVRPRLVTVDLWNDQFLSLPLAERDPQCPCCGRRDFVFLEPA
ncbi:MAG: thiazole biosynthesis adenylyltransferase ThiF [Myxococcales bacterium]|nr:thiazole biosynthesis adenylyltransferase ThiF [Myxococcales bacterium]